MWPQYEKLCRSKMLQEENGVILKATYEVPKVDFNSCVFDSNYSIYAGARCVFQSVKYSSYLIQFGIGC